MNFSMGRDEKKKFEATERKKKFLKGKKWKYV